MRQEALNTVYELAKKDKRVVFIGSDLGAGTLSKMKEEFPDRFFMEGISEQHILGFASGLAREGFIPYLNTIATFFSRRAFEQIAMDVALHNLPVRILASGGGMVYAPLGPTHTAIEDISLMLSVPNLKVFSPADAHEMRNLIEFSANDPFPWYVRFGKGGEEIVTPELQIEPWKPKKFGNLTPEILFLTTGVVLQIALRTMLKLNTKAVGIVHFPYLNDLFVDEWLDMIKSAERVIVIEEHVPRGGLFTQLLHVCHERRISTFKFSHVSLKSEYSHHYGSQKDHLDYNGISEENLVKMVTDEL